MPRHLVPKKSGVHRAACFALYRALLRQQHKLQLDKHQQRLFRKPIRAVFKRNAKLQSPPQICTALQLGYETLEGLHDGARHQQILDRIFEPAAQPTSNAPLEDLPSSTRTKTVPAHKAPKPQAAPHSGTSCILDRPFQRLSGRRHVPVLVNANRVPILRIKKPQPHLLSRIIRDIAKTRNHRIASAARLADELSIAEDEDHWDQILYEHTGLDLTDSSEQHWQLEVKQALDENNKLQVRAIQKRAEMSAKMYAIVEKEKALAEEEKLRIRDGKHKARKARRLARRGLTESETPKSSCSETKNSVTRDSPTMTEEVHNRDQEEVRPPNREIERRERSDNYKTSDELKRLREASLRPRTAEEIAKIKEARARRKEEESERKAQKLIRRQEKAAHLERKVNEEVMESTNKRLDTDELEDLNRKPLPPKPTPCPEVRQMGIRVQPKASPLQKEPKHSERKVNETVEESKEQRLDTDESEDLNRKSLPPKPTVCLGVRQIDIRVQPKVSPLQKEPKHLEQKVNETVEESKEKRPDTDKSEDLNRKPVSPKPTVPPVTRRTWIEPQPEVSTFQKEQRQASGLRPDAPRGWKQTKDRKLDRFCQSLFKENLRNILRRGSY